MNRTIIVTPKKGLLSIDYFDELGEWLRREPGSREKLINNATEALYAFHEWGGKLFTSEGEPIPIVPGLFDDAHSENSSGEWISEQRRREKARRSPKHTLLGRLQTYDALSRICGRPVGRAARREEIAKMRKLLAAFSPAVSSHYLAEARKLRDNNDARDLRYGSAIRRLRIECSEFGAGLTMCQETTVNRFP
jgi:hypothetical protein